MKKLLLLMMGIYFHAVATVPEENIDFVALQKSINTHIPIVHEDIQKLLGNLKSGCMKYGAGIDNTLALLDETINYHAGHTDAPYDDLKKKASKTVFRHELKAILHMIHLQKVKQQQYEFDQKNPAYGYIKQYVIGFGVGISLVAFLFYLTNSSDVREERV